MAIKIVIAAIKNLTSEGYLLQLRQRHGFEVCGFTDNVEKFCQLVDAHDPDVVIIGLAFQGAYTDQFIRRFLLHRPQTKFVISGARLRELVSNKILESGAMGFICPIRDNFDELIIAIQSANLGLRYLSPTVQTYLKTNDQLGTRHVSSDTPLSNREIEILQLVAQGKSSKEVAK